MALTTLFLDMNSYFASVEQQLSPELRHRPVAVVIVNTDTTCCISVSYEAKRYGVKTGTPVGEAKRRCPTLRIVEARPAVYVQHHHAIRAAVETCLHVDAVHSIDELSCRLMGVERRPERAVELAHRIKQALRRQVGEHLRCSIGLAPNRFLAKVAADMQKPDGLVVITLQELPAKLYSLKLDDLPGIGARRLARLHRYGIKSVEQLYALSEKQLATLWHSVVGQQWWHWLHGDDWPETPTQRRTVAHSHVLPPKLRNDTDARAVLVHLIHKTAVRMRHLGYGARQLRVHVAFLHREYWEDRAEFGLGRDTLTFLQTFACLWDGKPPGRPLKVGITLEKLVADASATTPLFPEEQNRLRLARTMDWLNSKFGPHTVYFAGMHGALEHAPLRISYTCIPDLDLPV